MKARKRNSNDEWKEVEYVQLRDSYVITKSDQMEFQYDNLSTNQTEEEKHWQYIREKAAIAAMQGTIGLLSDNSRTAFREIVIEGFSGNQKTYPNEIAEFAVACADTLIEQLKTDNKK